MSIDEEGCDMASWSKKKKKKKDLRDVFELFQKLSDASNPKVKFITYTHK